MNIQKQMIEKNFAEVNFEANTEELQMAMDSFDRFLSLSSTDKSAGDYQINSSTTGNFGYFRRVTGNDMNGRTAAADTKHIYHFGSNTRQAFEAFGWKKLPAEAREFCDRGESIYWLGVASLRSTLKDLHDCVDPANIGYAPDMRSDFLNPTRLLNIHLRFLGYEAPEDVDTPIAKGHFDRSVFTLALAETAPGLEIGRLADGSDLVPVTHTKGIAKFFAGKGWDKMPAEYRDAYDFIQPAYHQARNLGIYRNLGGPVVRQALILFANSINHLTDPAPDETRPIRQLQSVA